jgi:hypothetical protein
MTCGCPRGCGGDLEAAVGDDLGDVRIHAGAKGAQTAAGHAARAVAIGQDVYVGAGGSGRPRPLAAGS